MAIRPLAHFTLIGALIGGGQASAPMAIAAPAAPSCRIEGWSRDADPAGLRVRDAPNARARVLGRLPRIQKDDDGRRIGPTFRIIGARNGWLRIADARVEGGRHRSTSFPAAGWVHGGLVGFAVQDSRGYAAPDAASPVVLSSGRDWLTPAYSVEAVLDCKGVWAQVRLQPQRAVRPVWVTHICANQWTTCDMATPPR